MCYCAVFWNIDKKDKKSGFGDSGVKNRPFRGGNEKACVKTSKREKNDEKSENNCEQ